MPDITIILIGLMIASGFAAIILILILLLKKHSAERKQSKPAEVKQKEEHKHKIEFKAAKDDVLDSIGDAGSSMKDEMSDAVNGNGELFKAKDYVNPAEINAVSIKNKAQDAFEASLGRPLTEEIDFESTPLSEAVALPFIPSVEETHLLNHQEEVPFEVEYEIKLLHTEERIA